MSVSGRGSLLDADTVICPTAWVLWATVVPTDCVACIPGTRPKKVLVCWGWVAGAGRLGLGGWGWLAGWGWLGLAGTGWGWPSKRLWLGGLARLAVAGWLAGTEWLGLGGRGWLAGWGGLAGWGWLVAAGSLGLGGWVWLAGCGWLGLAEAGWGWLVVAGWLGLAGWGSDRPFHGSKLKVLSMP